MKRLFAATLLLFLLDGSNQIISAQTDEVKTLRDLRGVEVYLGWGIKAHRSGDYATALRIMRAHSEQGNADAQYILGFMYFKGQGVTQDYAAALKWYRKAADQGNASAELNLGILYQGGHGVAEDYAAAVKWYRKAAAQGSTVAQINLGVMYEDGQGVTQDYVQAHMWYNLAAAQGQKDTGEWRDSLAEKMTPAQIVEAQRLAREWVAKRKREVP